MILVTDYAVDKNANVYVSDILMDSASLEIFIELDPRTFASDLLVVFKDEYGLELDAVALQGIPASLISKVARHEPIQIEDVSSN
jgi:hypothetical protein